MKKNMCFKIAKSKARSRVRDLLIVVEIYVKHHRVKKNT